MKFLTPEQVRTLLETASDKYRPVFLTAVMTGLRLGELLALKWDDVDWEAGLIRVRRSLDRGKVQDPKTKRSRRDIALPQAVSLALKRLRLKTQRTGTDWIFQTGRGTPLDPRNLVQRHFEPTLKRAGLPKIRFHDLRHTYASLMIDQGESAKFVQDQMGHASVATTFDIYGHLFPSTRKAAAERLQEKLFG